MLKSQSLALGINQLLQIVHNRHLNLCWIWISSVKIIIFFQKVKATKAACADKFVVQFTADLCNPRSQMALDFKNLIQRYHGFSFHLHIFILANVGKTQSCQILPVGNGLSGTAVTIWWNRLLDGLKSAGTTFSWTPGDQRADIQLAASSEQRTLLESTLLNVLISTECAFLKCVN